MADEAAAEEEDYSDLMDLFDDDSQGDESEEPEQSSGMFEGGQDSTDEDEPESGEDDADKNQSEEVSEEDTPAEPEPESGQSDEQVDQNTAQEDRRRTQNLENLTERLASIQEQNERRRQQEEQERQQRAQQEAQQRAQEERSKPLYDPEQLSLTDEERAAYKDALPVLNKVARSVAQDVHDRSVRPLQEEVERLRRQTQSIDDNANQGRAEAFVSAIRGAVPDLDQRTKAPGWENYMNELVSVPGQGSMTRAQAVQLATKSSDLNYVVDQVKGFNLDTQSGAKPQSAKSPGNGQASAESAKPKKSRSESISYAKSMAQLDEMSQKVRNGRMSLEKYEDAVDKFEAAMEAGRVDMDS